MRLVILILLISLFSCAKMKNQSPQKLQAELQKTNYGRALLHQDQSQSYWTQSKNQFLEDRLEQLDFNFQRRTNEHNSLLVQLNQQIQQAQIDVSRSDDVIENLLIPSKEQLELRISKLEEYYEQNNKRWMKRIQQENKNMKLMRPKQQN